MKKYLKWAFYIYVIFLAGSITYKKVMGRRIGRQEVPFKMPQRQCFIGGEGWKYCVHDSEFSQKDVYLYVLHGKGQDEEFWTEATHYPGLLQNYWQSQGMRIPRVITISFGPLWLITPQLAHEDTGLLEVFRNQVFRKIEGHLGAPQERRLVGASMGGLNALSLAMHFPKMFSKVASLCPVIYELSPLASPAEIFGFFRRTGAKLASAGQAILLGRKLFGTQEEWKSFSPLELAKRVEPSVFPQLYLSCGIWDAYGNFEGSYLLAQTLMNRGISVVWQPNSGGHCAVDTPSLGDFLKVGR